MRWITSAGGPLVLVPKSMVGQWHGVTDGGSDYRAACSVVDYADAIRWRGVDVLVLNDEPLATTCLANGLTMFLRWMYAPDEAAITHEIEVMAGRFAKQQHGVAMHCRESSYILFDAGAPGKSTVETIEVDLAPGAYLIETHVWKPNEEVGVIVHILRPDENFDCG